MDFEDYLACTYTPIKAIEVLSNIIYDKCNSDWELFSEDFKRSDFDELIALNFLVKLCAKHLLNDRKTAMNEI